MLVDLQLVVGERVCVVVVVVVVVESHTKLFLTFERSGCGGGGGRRGLERVCVGCVKRECLNGVAFDGVGYVYCLCGKGCWLLLLRKKKRLTIILLTEKYRPSTQRRSGLPESSELGTVPRSVRS